MRTLILGGTGMLGQALVREARERAWPALAPSHGQVDIADPARIGAAVEEFRPQLLVNCAAFTKVDDCETRREHALAVNGTAVAGLAAAARAHDARLVHVSSDYVFDGEGSSPYAEDAPTRPLSVYGESKLLGEREALRASDSLVVRASWLFGPGGPNFMATMLQLFERSRRDGTPVRVVRDQVGAPTYTPFLARAICDLAVRGTRGVVHYRNHDAVSWHGFASAIARASGYERDVVPITTAEFPRPARRPSYSVLAVDHFEAIAARRVETWSAGIELYLELLRRRTN